MTLQEYVQKNKPLLEHFLITYLNSQKGAIFYSDQIVEKLVDFTTHGKMLRGLIICLVGEMYGKGIDDTSLSLAAAIELNHSALLIHDDILDNDRLRRGRKTIFAQYEEEGKTLGVQNPYFYGTSNAICVGDVSIFLAVKLFKNLSQNAFGEVIHSFYQEMVQVGLAEQYEFAAGQKNDALSEESILEIYKYKTARYTFSLPMRLGGLIAGTQKQEIDLLDTIGEELGIIFQMKDDEIGLLGNEEAIGKPVGSDIRENKKTFIRNMLFASSNDDERIFLNSSFGNEALGWEDIKKIQDIAIKYKIHELVQEEIKKRAEKILPRIDELSVSKEYKMLLCDFVEYNITRVS